MITLLPYAAPAAIVGMLAFILYAITVDARRELIGARRKALIEAEAALRSLASVAKYAAWQTKREPLTGIRLGHQRKQLMRAYHYDRAANIVASIPVDRL